MGMPAGSCMAARRWVWPIIRQGCNKYLRALGNLDHLLQPPVGHARLWRNLLARGGGLASNSKGNECQRKWDVGAVDGPCVPRTAGCWTATYYSLSTTCCSIRSTCYLYASRASDTAKGCGHYPPLATDYVPHTTTTTTHYARLHTCSLVGA